MQVLSSEQRRLRAVLGSETEAMLQRHEAQGTLDHPEYQAVVTLLTYRHLCRLPEWPDCLKRSVSNMHLAAYHAMQGQNEFVFTGNLRGWERLDQLHRITLPVLILAGLHDVVTPLNAQLMQERLPHARTTVFQNSSHTPFLEEPDAYFRVLVDFLEDKDQTP